MDASRVRRWRFSRGRLSLPGAYPLDPITDGSALRFSPVRPGQGRRTALTERVTVSTDPLDAVINVRVSQSEKNELRDAATAAGMTLSAYCRRRFLGRVVMAHTDRVMIRELRRLGGLLKKVHVDSRGAYSQQTAAALDVIRKTIERLADDRQEDPES